MNYFYLALIGLNLSTFLLYGADKHRACKNRRRIPERQLLLSALFLGALGAFLGMRVFRHKIRKPLFKIGVPCMLILELALAVRVMYLFL